MVRGGRPAQDGRQLAQRCAPPLRNHRSSSPSPPWRRTAGEYSNFWSDPDQFKGIVVFSAVLAAFFSLGNLGAAILLPWLYNKPIDLCFQAIVLGYPCGQ